MIRYIFKSLYVLFTFCLIVSLPLNALTLLDRFQDAENGDFVVISEGKHLTLFHILERTKEILAIEEITIQERNLPANISWQAWVKARAPQHTAWTISTFDILKQTVVSTYSYSSQEQLFLDEQFSFLSTLLKLELQSIPSNSRKRVGVPPMDGEQDHRKIWHPVIIFDGKKQETSCSAYTALIPQGIPEVGGKRADLYFPSGDNCLNYFPYWIEIRGAILKVKLRVIDSGKQLSSPASVKNNTGL